MKILLVDDDANLLDVTAYALRREGFTVVAATDGAQALRRWEAARPDVVVLDVGLPRVDGLDVLRRIRQSKERADTPVLLLTGLTSEADVRAGFAAGADDHVPKPFSPAELVARIRAVGPRGARAADREPVALLRVGDLVLDPGAHATRRGDAAVSLTPVEFRLLYLLATHAGRVVGAARLVAYAWGDSAGADRRDPVVLKGHLTHLRQKLGFRRGRPGDITAAVGAGYRLDLDPEAPAPPA